jgi:hypothetical protein
MNLPMIIPTAKPKPIYRGVENPYDGYFVPQLKKGWYQIDGPRNIFVEGFIPRIAYGKGY